MSIEVPRSASRCSTAGERLLAGGSTPAVGSSMTSSVGSPGQGAGDEHAALLAAGERRDLGRAARSASPTSAIASRTTARSVAGRPASTTAGAGAARPRRSRSTVARTDADSGVPLGHVADPGVLGEALAGGRRTARRRRPAASVSPRRPRTSVDLPDPLGPSRATTSPGCSSQVDVADDRPVAVAERRPPRQADEGCGGRRHGQSCPARSVARLRAHHLEVVVAGRGVGEALERVEHGDASPRPRGRRSRRGRGRPGSRSRPS